MKPLLISAARHVIGYGLVLPLILLAIAVQVLVFGPLLQNRRTLPHLIFRLCALPFGVHFRLNPASAPFATDRTTLFLSNHLSRLDFAGLYLFPDAALMMNAMFFRMAVLGPVIRAFAASAGIVGTEQTLAGKARDLEHLAQATDQGRHIFIYAEGIQTDGRRLLRYSPGAAELFYDPVLLARHPALAKAQVQPVIYRVHSINGTDVLTTPDAWGPYSLASGRSAIFAGMSRLTKVGTITIDILVCAPLDPHDYANAADLTAAAHEVARAIIAPGQTRTLTRRQWKQRLDVRDFSL
jgi:1-acyl-sn-glycerol-3-phosphate acyltransferase